MSLFVVRRRCRAQDLQNGGKERDNLGRSAFVRGHPGHVTILAILDTNCCGAWATFTVVAEECKILKKPPPGTGRDGKIMLDGDVRAMDLSYKGRKHHNLEDPGDQLVVFYEANPRLLGRGHVEFRDKSEKRGPGRGVMQ